MSRFIRKLIYGAFYLSLLGFIVYGLVAAGLFATATCFDNRQNQGEEEADCGGPCVACAIKKLLPLRSEAQFFGVDNNTNVVLNFSNPNITYGAASFSYTVNFYNQSGGKVFSLNRNSLIYPAEAQKTIVEPNLRFNAGEVAGQPEILIENLDWRPATEFSQPKTQTRQVQIQISNRQANLTGILANRESFVLPRVTVGVVLVNKVTRVPVGASKTILLDVKPFEERAFKITSPLSTALKFSEIDFLIAVEAAR